MYYRKEIVYSRETRDFAMYMDGELVGFARTHTEAETTLDALVFELLSTSVVGQVEQAQPVEVAADAA